MKNGPVKSAAKAGTVAGHRSGQETVTVGDCQGRIVSRDAAGVAQRLSVLAVPAGITYDAEDIEEANRMGAALRRQNGQ